MIYYWLAPGSNPVGFPAPGFHPGFFFLIILFKFIVEDDSGLLRYSFVKIFIAPMIIL